MNDEDQAPLGAARLERLSAKMRTLQQQAHKLSHELLLTEIEMDLALREIREAQGGENHGKTIDDLEALGT